MLHSHGIAVVGLCNVLLGDDGFGPLAVEMFRSLYECDSMVEILDLGTPGLDLARYLGPWVEESLAQLRLAGDAPSETAVAFRYRGAFGG